MDWLDLLAVQGTLKSLLQHHNSKASILLRSAFSLLDCLIPRYDCLISLYFTTQIPENTNRINLAFPGLSSVFYTRLPQVIYWVWLQGQEPNLVQLTMGVEEEDQWLSL